VSETNVVGAQPLSQFLRMAVIAGVESAVQIHIDRGDDLNARDASGMTPLMLSGASNRPAICRLLLRAGADHGLLDHLGRTALGIAIATGSNDVAAILDAIDSPIAYPPAFDPEAASDAEWAARTYLPQSLAQSAKPEPGLVAPPSLAIEMDDDGELDLSGWEAEEEAAPPEDDLTILGAASAIQIAITSHEPVDSSASWDDIDAYLPEQALPLARADNAEGRSRLRLFLLRAIREGSVPILDVQELSTNDDRSVNPEAEAFLTLIVNDLGAEVDERFEYADASECFEVFVDPEETAEEEAALDQALSAIDSAASPRHEPLRIYQREFQRLRLLTAEEEVELAQAMEAALEAALDALASWPEGIARILAAGAEAIAGARPLSSLWLGDAEPDPEPASIDNADVGASEADSAEEAADEAAEAPAETGDAGFADALHRLGALAERGGAQPPTVLEIRLALTALRLNRRFLLKVGDASDGSATCPGFGRALIAFRKSRDRMTAANLKLAFFHAKKYLYSGEPLDDLAQEANIGLLKAVDRYEWRRGYRFSTYATWWIRQQIGRHVADKARTIRVPVHIYEKTQRLERVADAFETAFGREPTVDELAERMEMPADKVAALLRIAPEPVPIDELPVDDMIAIDARESFAPPDPADVVEAAQLRAAVDGMLSSLPNKDERILRLRFGIGVGVDEALTLDEIGQRYAVTRERIRQIEAKAIRKLQHPARAESFARLALGIQLPPRPIAQAMEEIDSADDDEAADQDQVAEPRKKQTPSARADRAPINSASASKPSSLERILAHAAELGIRVEDDRSGSSGRIWVNLMDTPKSTHRRLARRLLEFGFALWPGKGYWR
jgi:RNA polymerase primary sigma factor